MVEFVIRTTAVSSTPNNIVVAIFPFAFAIIITTTTTKQN